MSFTRMTIRSWRNLSRKHHDKDATQRRIDQCQLATELPGPPGRHARTPCVRLELQKCLLRCRKFLLRRGHESAVLLQHCPWSSEGRALPNVTRAYPSWKKPARPRGKASYPPLPPRVGVPAGHPFTYRYARHRARGESQESPGSDRRIRLPSESSVFRVLRAGSRRPEGWRLAGGDAAGLLVLCLGSVVVGRRDRPLAR